MVQAVKFGRGSIMMWSCFSFNSPISPIHKIDGILDKEKYVTELKVILPWAEENLPVIWQCQHANDPKHMAKVTKNFVEDNSINVLE